MNKKNIFIILPFKESLNPKIAGAVSIYVRDSLITLYIKKILKLFPLTIRIKKFLETKIIYLIFVKKIKKKKLI